ncbi:MAG: hypothetical protein C4555_01885 [Dehalococcoidia bacterium]|nr:MAG: hypothetical protein C4555_01885 [Dehalococcoidia bacterium]
MRGLHSTWRKRILLLVLAIVPQLLSLAGMAGLFWLLKIKDVFNADISWRSESQQILLSFGLTAEDRSKVTVGSVMHLTIEYPTRYAGQSFLAKVTKISKVTTPSSKLAWQVEAKLLEDIDQKTPPLSTEGQLPPMAATVWTRTRRALTVLLDRAALSQAGRRDQTGGLKANGAL